MGENCESDVSGETILHGECDPYDPGKYCDDGDIVDDCRGLDGICANDDDCPCQEGYACYCDGVCKEIGGPIGYL